MHTTHHPRVPLFETPPFLYQTPDSQTIPFLSSTPGNSSYGTEIKKSSNVTIYNWLRKLTKYRDQDSRAQDWKCLLLTPSVSLLWHISVSKICFAGNKGQ